MSRHVHYTAASPWRAPIAKRHEPTKAANRAASHCTCAWCFDFRSTPYDCRWPSLDVRRARARTSTMPPISNAAAPRYGEDDVEPGRSPTICCAEQLYPTPNVHGTGVVPATGRQRAGSVETLGGPIANASQGGPLGDNVPDSAEQQQQYCRDDTLMTSH